MGQKDISEKLLEEYNDVFADIVNVLLFDGKPVVSPAQLEETRIRAQYKADDSRLHEMERDVAKNWMEEGVTIALYGIENQEKADKVMPLRVFGYEGASYRSQLLTRENQQKKNPLYPVVTIILHFGKTRWNQPKNLKKVIPIPSAVDPYVNDIKIHVFEIAWLSDKQVQMFKSDFRVVAEFFTQMRKNNTFRPSEKELKHVDAVLKLLSVFGNVEFFDDYVKVHNQGTKKKEGKNMASLFDEIMNKKIEEAAEERVKELTANIKLDQIDQLKRKLKMPLEDLLAILEMPIKEYEQLQMQTK